MWSVWNGKYIRCGEPNIPDEVGWIKKTNEIMFRVNNRKTRMSGMDLQSCWANSATFYIFPRYYDIAAHYMKYLYSLGIY